MFQIRVFSFLAILAVTMCLAFSGGFAEGLNADKTMDETTAPEQHESWFDRGEKPMAQEEYTMDAEALEIAIDIKPDSADDKLNLKEDKMISVAVLGSRDFNVDNIDQGTLTLQDEKGNGNFRLEDVNKDGISDLVGEFPADSMLAFQGEKELIVKGKTKDGKSFEGKSTATFE